MATPGVPTSLAFVDTNVLLYAFDQADPVKRQTADSLLDTLRNEGSLVISTQVLHEFYWNATRPNRGPGMSSETAQSYLEDLRANAQVVVPTIAMTFLAIETSRTQTVSFWDALIWASAKEAGCGVVYSEDFQDGGTLQGVAFQNPFA